MYRLGASTAIGQDLVEEQHSNGNNRKSGPHNNYDYSSIAIMYGTGIVLLLMGRR